MVTVDLQPQIETLAEQWRLIPQELDRVNSQAGRQAAAAGRRVTEKLVRQATGIKAPQLRFARRLFGNYDAERGVARIWFGTDPYPAEYAGVRGSRKQRKALREFDPELLDEVEREALSVMLRTYHSRFEALATQVVARG